MRKMFTRLFGLTLLMYLVSSLTVAHALEECDISLISDSVKLVTDPATVCDGADLLYEVVGFTDAEYAFNYDGNDEGGFTTNSTVSVPEGVSFTVQVKVGDCYSEVITVSNQSVIEPVQILPSEVEHPVCYDDKGEVTVKFSGNHAPYKYYIVADAKWQDPAQNPVDNPGLLSGYEVLSSQIVRGPGSYWVAVQDANDCINLLEEANWDSTWVNAAPDLIVVDTIYGSNPECIDGLGTVTVEVVGGGTPYMASGSPEYMVELVGSDSVKMTNNLMATFMVPMGEYTATVIDSNLCEVNADSSVVLTDPAAITFDIEIVDVDCYGDTGAIHIVNLAGPEGAEFKASLGDGNWVGIALGDTIIKLTGLTADYYSVYVDNVNDACDSVGYVNPNNTQNTVSVQAPGLIEFDVTVGTITCNGGTTTIAVSNEEGGSGTYEYQLEDENGVVHIFSSTKTWNDVPAGNGYVVTVRDANATTCEISSVAYNITEPSVVAFDDIDVISPTCFDGTDGIINIDAEGGNGTYQYKLNDGQWKDNNVFSAAAGIYTVWVRDPLCPDQATSTVVEVDALAPNELVLGLLSDTVNECYGVNANQIVVREMSWASQANENRALTVMITDDVNAVYVSGEEMAPWTQNTYRVVNVDPGTYYIWAVDNLGCVFDADQDGTADYITVTVIEPEELKVEGAVTDNATCYGENDGVMTIKHNGGGNDDWYGYGHANTLQAAMNLPNGAFTDWPTDADSVDINVVGDADGIDYYVVVMDDCGQKAYYGPLTVFGFDPVEIDEDAVSIKNIKCFGDTDGEIVVANATGGSGNLVYTLKVKGNETAWEEVDGWVNTDATTYTGLGAGTYKVVVTDQNGCAGDETDDIIVEGPLSGVEIDEETFWTSDISCFGAGNGKVYIEALGGTPPYQFKTGASNWRDFPEDSNKKLINVLEPGTYTVIIRDSEMCESEPMNYTIAEPAEIMIAVNVTNNTSSCDMPANGELDVTVTGGRPGVTYDILINNSAPVVADSAVAENFSDLQGGYYTVTATESDANACEASVTVYIASPDTITFAAVVMDSVHCTGGSDGVIVVSDIDGGTAPYYTTIDGPVTAIKDSTATAITFSNLAAGVYEVKVTDAAGCSQVMGLTISEPTQLTLNATKIQDITCAEDGMFSVQVAEGTPGYVYYTAMSDPATGHVLVTDLPTPASNWQADSIFTVTEAGTWIVWAMDANECIIGGEEDEDGPVNAWRVKIEEVGTPDVAFTGLEVISNDYCGDTTGVIGFSAVEFSFDGVPYATTYSVEYQEGIWNSSTDEYVAGAKWASDSDTVSALSYRGYRFVLTDNTTGCTVNSEWLTVEGNAPMVVTLEKGDGEFACPDATDGYIEATVVSGGEGDYTYILYQDGDSVNTYTENSFLVPINSSYVVHVKDANGCMMASEALVLDPVAPVVIEDIKDVTCSDDALASLKVTVSGEEGRQFQVKWRLYEETLEYTTAEWFEAGDIYLNEMFEFDNEEIQDKHYEIVVVDDMGCMSAMDTITIDQKPGSSIMLTTTVGEVNGCGTEVMVVAAGGVAPYSYLVNGEVAEGTTLLLGGGTHVIQAMDAHECMDADTITLAYPMSVDTTFNIFVGDTAHLVYGTIDEMFTEDVTATFYDMSDENCTVEVNVEVITREKTAPVLDTVSPMGDIQDNHPTFVITFEEDVTFNEAGVLTVTKKDSANATLTLTITPEMVSGNTVTVTYDNTVSGGLNQHTTYVVAVDGGVVMGDGLTWDGNVPYAWEFTTGDFATGITPDVETVEFKVYPNPFSSFIRIDNAQKLDRVIVSNIAGQRVLDIENPTYEIRTGNLVTGVYVVTLIANDEIVKSERIIKR